MACANVLVAALAVVAGCTQPPVKPSLQHVGAMPSANPQPAGEIPSPVVIPTLPPRPQAVKRPETYSVVVNEVPVRDLLFALARDARVNVDVHPGIAGNVTLNAINQTLQQLLNRVSKQVDLRWEMDGQNLSVLPDNAFLRMYKVDYVNMTRVSDTNVSVSTEISSTGRGAGSSAGGSNSSTTVTSQSANRFWDSLALNVCSLVAATRVITREERETLRTQQQRDRDDRLSVARSLAAAGAGAPQLMQQVTPASTTPLQPLQINCTPQQAGTGQAGSALTLNNPVIANRETGVVSVYATERQHERVQEFLDRVQSSAKRQVLIEATVVEVELSSNYQQGINWQRLQGSGNTGTSLTVQPIGPTALPGGVVPGPGAVINPVTSSVVNPGSLTSGMLQIGYVNPTSRLGNIAAALTLLESFGKVRVLSSPKISVLNNQTAILKVVNNLVYFSIGATITPATPTSAAVNTYTSTANTVAVGFVMSVTPQIDDLDAVSINVRPTISRLLRYVNDPNPELARAGIRNPVPEVQTREMESILKVPNQQIAVMGGLMQDSVNDNEDGVPGVNRIPGIGELFRYRNEQSRKSELVIFLRPVVLKDASLDGDFRNFREFLPTQDFFSRPNPLQPQRFGANRTDDASDDVQRPRPSNP